MSFFLADQVAPYAWFPEGASSFAPQVDFLFTVILWICIVFFVPIVIAMGYFMWVYRERPGYRGSPEALHNTAIEITWTVVPTIVVVWVFWAFKYENGGEHDVIPVENSSVKELPLLVLPVDRDIKMIMRSDDVLHSFYIPAFRAKRDVVPGRYNYMWFHTTKEGLYDLFCTEYCGDNHSQMNAKVKVVSQEEYKKALDKAIQEPEDPLARGQLLYKRQGCSTCHNAGAEGASGPGPSYNGSWGKPVQLESGAEVAFDENYVRESILNPQAKARKGYGKASPMNSYAGKLKDDQIDALITFIKSLENANSATKK